MSFTPYLFIGIGETSAFFTLRETYMHEQWVGGQDGYMDKSVRSYHHFNLSQTAEEAFEKAKQYSEKMCLELRTTLEQLDQEMRDIKKANAKQMAERWAKMKAQDDMWAAQRAEEAAERIRRLESGLFVFGAYAGKAFEEAPRGYLSWMMDKVETCEEGSILRLTAEAVLAKVPHLALPKPDKEMIAGEPKKRLIFDVTVTASRYFVRTSFNGFSQEVVHVTTMVTSEGACLVCFSTSFAPEEGSELKIKATVKEHSEYKGQAQTIVQRVTIL